VVEPNRLRGQVEPSKLSGSGASAATQHPRARHGGERTANQRVAIAAIGELAVLALVAVVSIVGWTGSEPPVAWLVGHLVLGIALGLLMPSTWLVLGSIVAGMLAAAIVVWFAFLGAWALGVLPPALAPTIGSMGITALVGLVLVVGLLGVPIVIVGRIFGNVPGMIRGRWRHGAIARGEAPLEVPSAPLVNESQGTAALYGASLIEATADGAATQVVRIYDYDSGERLLKADQVSLAQLGYSLTRVDRKPPKSGTGWAVLQAVGLVIDLVAMFSHAGGGYAGDAFDSVRKGRLTATFDLGSPTHEPIPVPAEDESESREALTEPG
jgi:MFS family permease